jgi:hypothetical protein
MLYGPWGCPCGWSEYAEYDQRFAEPGVDQWGGFTRASFQEKNTSRETGDGPEEARTPA